MDLAQSAYHQISDTRSSIDDLGAGQRRGHRSSLSSVVLHCTVSVGLAAAALCLLSALGLAASAQRDPDPAWEGPVGRGGYSTDDVWKSRRWRLRRPRWEARAGHGARQGRPGGDGSQAHSALRLAGRVQPRTCGPSSASCSGRSSPPAS
ncbi:unnamed protein product [Prorocentrum cordatum]|nr:unnamed protein product [Polarella glacialis]